MGSDSDTIERLAAADPLPDGGQLGPDERREADALLARVVATPGQGDGRGPRARRRARRPRRVAALAASAACVALAAVVATDLTGTDGGGAGAIDRAIAATTDDDAVYHVVQRSSIRYETSPAEARERLGLEDGAGTVVEFWSSGDSWHGLTYRANGPRRGRLVVEGAYDGWEERRYDPRADRITISCCAQLTERPDDAPADRGYIVVEPGRDAGSQLQQLHERGGLLSVAGGAGVRGGDAYRLVSHPIRRNGTVTRYEFLVDADSYMPLRSRTIHRHPASQMVGPTAPRSAGLSDATVIATVTHRYLVYERLERSEESLAKLELLPRPGATVHRPGPARRSGTP